jgi:glutamyl-tRNA synthetase
MNGEHLRRLPTDTHRHHYLAALPAAAADTAYLDAVIAVMQERIKKWPDIAAMAGFFFDEAFAYDEDAMAKRFSREGAWSDLTALRDAWAQLDPFSADAIEASLRALAEARGLKPADLIHPARLAVSGIPQGPSLFHMLEVLGRDRVVQRIERTLQKA